MECESLKKLGYSIIEINVENITLYVKKNETQSKVIIIFDCYAKENFTQIQLKNAVSQILDSCKANGFDNIKLMKVLYCESMSYAKKVCEDAVVINILEQKIMSKNDVTDWKEELEIFEEELTKLNILIKKSISTSKKHANSGTKTEIIGFVKMATTWIIIVNAIINFASEFIYYVLDNVDLYNKILDEGCVSWAGVVEDGQVYRIITSMFLHSDIDHLFGNMISLCVIGFFLETIIGKRKLIFIYLSTGIVADLVSISYNMLQDDVSSASIGASGAVFGVMGAVVALFIVNRNVFGESAAGRLLLYSVIMIYTGVTSEGVDNAAHIGGFAAGIMMGVIMFYLVPRFRKNHIK